MEARQERTILRLEKTIRRCDLVIVDELGYLPLDRMDTEHLFGFFSQCCEQTSLIVTTNLPFADWPQVFASDERLAGALLDRLTWKSACKRDPRREEKIGIENGPTAVISVG